MTTSSAAAVNTNVNPSFWHHRRVFLTGHTGFKGAWLALWLQQLGAEVHGYALAPATEPNVFTEARIAKGLASSTIGDVRDLGCLSRAMRAARPEVVIHMAAQPLVRRSYAEPVETYATNVMGTVHLLESVWQAGCVRAVVNVTTDKCYENREWPWGYREDEPMGGHDPYSNSKGCAELVTMAYRRSFLAASGVAVATARAGNVIGGGDWSVDRLVPDLLKALQNGQAIVIRNPLATRPWQHVLEPLAGYLMLGERLAGEGSEGGQAVAEGWNFGPADDDARPVQQLVERLLALWSEGSGTALRWQLDAGAHPHEAHALKLDCSKARQRLGWRPRWSLDEALGRIVAWHRAWLAGSDMQAHCLRDIAAYSGVRQASTTRAANVLQDEAALAI